VEERTTDRIRKRRKGKTGRYRKETERRRR
jgi:hypothetical protein